MKNNNGFTLIEILVVLFIITSLSFLIIPNIYNQKEDADIKTCNNYIQLANTQLELYQLNNGVEPTLTQLVTEGYLVSETCPNGKSLVIINGVVVLEE